MNLQGLALRILLKLNQFINVSAFGYLPPKLAINFLKFLCARQNLDASHCEAALFEIGDIADESFTTRLADDPRIVFYEAKLSIPERMHNLFLIG